jgi:hypothetical protein
MATADCPRQPIPLPLRGLEIGSFAHDTIVRRLPEIGRRVVTENAFPPGMVTRLEALLSEIPGGLIRPPADNEAPDTTEWAAYVHRYQGLTWLELPWFFAENYFYRRILEATGYFQAGPGLGLDPYAYQKRLGLVGSLEAIDGLARQAERRRYLGWSGAALAEALRGALWGNQADLSLWPAVGDGEGKRPDHEPEAQNAHVLVDETAGAVAYLEAGRPALVTIVVDNAGLELVADLALVDYLLESGAAAEVRLQAKAHPTFVSDALPADLAETIAFLAGGAGPAARPLGQRLGAALESGRLALEQHRFWNSPLSGWEMVNSLRDHLAASRLVIGKGDAHYRRLLGDAHWPFTTPFAEITCYLPAAWLVLRTLKSEVVAGLAAGQPETLAEKDPRWLTNGRWGVMQFVNPAGG